MKRDTVEVVILGGGGSGRTALMRALDHQPFQENISHTTDSGYLQAEPTTHDPDPTVSMRVVDVPNPPSSNHADKRSQYVTRQTDAVLICFDTSDQGSFNEAKNIHRLIQDKSPVGAQVFLVGTKTDLPRTEYSVSQGEVLQYADSNDLRYVSCSARTGQRIEQVFEAAKSQVLQSRAPKIVSREAPRIAEASKESVPKKRLFGIGNKSASNSPQEQPKKDPDKSLEIVLSGIKLTQEQRVELNAMSMYSDAYVMAHAVLLNDNKLSHGSTHAKLKSGGEIIARTDRGGDGDKIAVTVEYNDQNAEQVMKEVAGRILKIAFTQQDTLDIRTSHDNEKLLAKALENKNLQPKELVYRVSIQGMNPKETNEEGPPAFIKTDDINKEIIRDSKTDEIKSLQQTATTSDKKGEMRSIANYLPRDQDTKQGAQLANQIQLELRPKPGQSLDANTVKEFQVEVERISELRRGTVQVDPSNPKEFNAILMPQPQAQAPVQVQQAAAAAVVVPKQPENPLPVQEKQSFRRASRMPPPIPLSRQKSIGELESFSPRDNQSDSAKSNPTLEKMPTSENLLKQVDEMTEKIFESPRGEGASSAEKNPVIQRLQSESVKVKSASAASVQDARSTLPSPGKK